MRYVGLLLLLAGCGGSLSDGRGCQDETGQVFACGETPGLVAVYPSEYPPIDPPITCAVQCAVDPISRVGQECTAEVRQGGKTNLIYGACVLY